MRDIMGKRGPHMWDKRRCPFFCNINKTK